MIRDITDIPALPGGLPFDATQIQFTPAGAGAVARTVQDKERDLISLFDDMTQTQIASVRAGNLAQDVSAAAQAVLDYAATLVPTPGTYSYGSVAVLAPAGIYKLNISIPTGVELWGIGGIVAFVGSVTGVVVDTKIYASGNTSHLNGGLRNVFLYGAGAGTPMVGLRINNAQNFVVDQVRLFNFADQGILGQTHFDGSGFTGSAALIKVIINDVIIQDCLLNKTRSVVNGCCELQGTDHEISNLEYLSSAGRTLSGSKRCVGLKFTAASAIRVHRARMDLIDRGFVDDVNCNHITYTDCTTTGALAEGFDIFGFKNEFRGFGVNSASTDTTNTYDAFALNAGSASNNLISGTIDSVFAPTKHPRYGIRDDNVTAASPNIIGAGVRVLEGQTAAVNFSGGTTSFSLPDGVELALADSATPTINGSYPWKNYSITNAIATTVTNFLGGFAGQIMTLTPTNANTTLKNNATIQTTTGADKALTSGGLYKLRMNAAGTKWIEF